jgi:hypothetical protein
VGSKKLFQQTDVLKEPMTKRLHAGAALRAPTDISVVYYTI